MRRNGDTVQYTAAEIDEMLRRGESKTDWARVDALTEEELEASIDYEEEGEPIWSTLISGLPPRKVAVTIDYDSEIIKWFQEQGPDYQSKINAVLKQYVQEHLKKAS